MRAERDLVELPEAMFDGRADETAYNDNELGYVTAPFKSFLTCQLPLAAANARQLSIQA